ncbi:hypothetical protein PINS_up018328 [Pythium insidiosum]|nr:hypothetical protein PINS_up018328 [Pythium insidiosum]
MPASTCQRQRKDTHESDDDRRHTDLHGTNRSDGRRRAALGRRDGVPTVGVSTGANGADARAAALFPAEHGLPELFPFSKYLRQEQDNQITHMIDIEMSMWVLLILLLWALDGVTVLVQVSEKEAQRQALILTYTAAVWMLTLLHRARAGAA